MEWVDAVASLLNVMSYAVWKQLVDHFLKIIVLALLGDDVNHPGTDPADLLGLGIGCLLDLVLAFFGEANAEDSESVAICGLQVNIGINQGLLWFNLRENTIYLSCNLKGMKERTCSSGKRVQIMYTSTWVAT